MIGGRYTLEREIGRGASGPVWLGRDEVLGRRVALKRIGRLPGSDGTDLARARREAQLSARLHHPNVVAVFDVVENDDDARSLVMEYVDGVDLGRLVADRGPLSPDEVVPLLRQVAEALLAAHRAGIVHRDVKPSNILLDAEGRAKLTDFGIARVAADASLTQTGLLTGSPAYLAPEVAHGARGDEPADVWALGATAFYLLTGRPPYDSTGHVLGTLVRIVNEEPPRLPEAGSLAPLLEGTMVKEPSARWSMQQVRDFLAAPPPVDSREGTRLLTSVGPPAPAADRRPSNRVLLLALGTVVAVVLAVVLMSSLFGSDSGSPGAAAPSRTPSDSASTSKRAHPTAAGMKAFIRDYVRTVSADPERAWGMLTPKFQRESGGLAKYRQFWEPATNGRVLSITAEPAGPSVSYQVHFDHFDNGPGPTVLDLQFRDGRYRIDGERTEGFEPAG